MEAESAETSETESAEVVVVEGHQAAGVSANLDRPAETSAIWNRDARLSGTPPRRASYPDLAGVSGVDILFIHAHPDDEALDYGALLAAAESAGKRVGVVLFTDGNAGLDQYPWRGVDTEYPSWRMRDSELSSVRIEEATRAMTRLGTDLYVRLGLPNHPYSGIEEELTVEEVTARWGGADALTEVVADIIQRLDPTLVVSPDGPSEAYEHFEHEAVGEVTAAAVRSLGGRSSVRAHLAPIDPLQTDVYTDVLAFDAWERPGDAALRYRDVQLAALREHRSQRDASVIGIEVRQGLRYEYYRAIRWMPRSEIPTPSFARLLSLVSERP
jgi:LmbE family N-acetylglucosaminyl deacetylase